MEAIKYMPPAPTPNVYAALAQVMREIDAIAKDKRNAAQGFPFRGIDDVYNSIHPLLAAVGLVTLPRVISCDYAERQSKSGAIQIHARVRVEYDFVAADGTKVTVGPVAAEAMDTSDKATNKAMAFAHKYCLLQTFCIPTEDVAEGDKVTIPASPAKVPAKEAVRAHLDASQEVSAEEPWPSDPEPTGHAEPAIPPDPIVPFKKGKNAGKKASQLSDKELWGVVDFMRANWRDKAIVAQFEAVAEHRGIEFGEPGAEG